MKYKLLIIALIFLSSCTSMTDQKSNTVLNIDIYQNDMTYEKFKKYAIEYAENSSYPNLSNK